MEGVSKNLDHLGIVSTVCRGIGLVEEIDSIIGVDPRQKVTCGEAVVAMVLNALGFVDRHLYLFPEFMATKPVEILIREGLKAESALRKYRREARKLLAESYESFAAETKEHTKREIENILNSLKTKGILGADAELDDILSLNIENILDRRLQTQVCKQGLARTMKQARQFIVHGHIMVANRKITIPSYIINREDEPQTGLYKIPQKQSPQLRKL